MRLKIGYALLFFSAAALFPPIRRVLFSVGVVFVTPLVYSGSLANLQGPHYKEQVIQI